MNQQSMNERLDLIKKQESILGKYKMGAVVKVKPEFNSFSGDFGHIIGFSTTLEGEVCLIVKTEEEEQIRYSLSAVELI